MGLGTRCQLAALSRAVVRVRTDAVMGLVLTAIVFDEVAGLEDLDRVHAELA